MIKINGKLITIVLMGLLLFAMMMQIPTIAPANAEAPSATSNWNGHGAMAHWDIVDTEHNNAQISMDVTYQQRTADGKSDLIYIKVVHPQGTSEATGYTVNITSGPTWSMDHVYLNATLTFNWTNGYSSHPISIDWLTSPPSVDNAITWQNGTTSYLPGEWRSGTGNVANATMTIGGSGPHPGNFTSDWACVGQTPTFSGTVNWTGQGAMAHWDIIDVSHGNTPISIDATYGQRTIDGKNSNMVDIKVIHSQGTSEAIGYSVNITSGPTWSMDHVYLNATLTFNWTNGYSAHPITLEWYSMPPTISNTITWQNGSTTAVPGTWRSGSGNAVNATIIIGGSGPHPGNFSSDWACVGQTPTFPAASAWTGQGAMAHWDIVDTAHSNALISIDAVYGQKATDGSGSNMLYIRVVHPQGTSEVTGYTVNMTSTPTWSMNHVFVNATLTFNWTNGYSAHPITIDWYTSGASTMNSITYQNGSASSVPGEWISGNGNIANATMTIGGSGPHPGNFTSDWACVGQTPTFNMPVNWTGQGAMAHWDIIDAGHGNVPISIDVLYAQSSQDGTKGNIIYIKVIHPQGTSEATGYTVNITSGPTWSMNHVSLNATLTFNWTNGYSAHPISIDWYTSGAATANSITWQNGTASGYPGNWISGTGNTANATMTIGGSGPHPGNFTSDWACVGQTPTFPAVNWTGQGAMAHWDIVDTSHGNALISIDASYGQQSTDSSGKTNIVWIKVIHPQGTSEVTGYAVNITQGPTWSSNHVVLNATLTFNWTNGYSAHPVYIEWNASAASVNNVITWQNGSTSTVNGNWISGTGNAVNATMTIGGSGPHPGTFVSDWAVIGQVTPAATPTPTPTAQPTAAPTAAPTATPAPTVKPTATPTATPTPTPSPDSIKATTSEGATIDLVIGGNITSSQITNAAITKDESAATTTLSFNVTGEDGSVGSGNVTIPKSAVTYGTIPTIYLDGQKVADQGYTQDSNNYYVWYTVHFSTHNMTVVFASGQQAASSGLSQVEIIAIAAVIAVIVVVAVVVALTKGRKKAKA